MCFLYLLLMWCNINYLCRGHLCTNTQATSFLFANLQVKYIGCNNSTLTSVVKSSKLDCARTCLNEGNCVAFSYNKTSGLCSVCSDYSVKSLVVDTGPSETFYGLRQNIMNGEMSTSANVDTWLDIPSGLTVGNMIVLRGVYANYSGFIFHILQTKDNEILHFRPRDYLIAINHFIDGQYGEGVYLTPQDFPFTLGEKFVVHILAAVDSYAIFVDGKFLHSYQYVLPPTAVRLMKVAGNMQLLELSV